MNHPSLQQPRDHYIDCRGLKLHCVEWGDPAQETLLLVHGNRDQSRSWDFFVAELDKLHPSSFHAVALDLRGHGESEWAPARRGYRHEDFVRDLSAVFHRIGKPQITIIGHSLGGSVSLLFAGCFPDRIRKLVLAEATGPFAKKADEVPEILAEQVEGRERQLERTVQTDLEDAGAAIKKRFPSIPDSMCLHMARFGTTRTESGLVWKHDPRLRLHSLSPLSENQIRAFIRRIRCPVLIVYGTASGFTKSSRFARLGLFSTARLVEVPATGHHVPHERPAELARIVSPFLFGD